MLPSSHLSDEDENDALKCSKGSYLIGTPISKVNAMPGFSSAKFSACLASAKVGSSIPGTPYLPTINKVLLHLQK